MDLCQQFPLFCNQLNFKESLLINQLLIANNSLRDGVILRGENRDSPLLVRASALPSASILYRKQFPRSAGIAGLMQIKKLLKSLLIFSLLAIILATMGCASARHPTNPQDPYESYNRKVFKFNMKVDKYVYRPVAKTYDTILPGPAKRGVTNFFENVSLVPSIINDMLQANVPWAASDTGRLVVNTTLGIGGLFDVASHMGLKKHDQDFGLTLAKWGVRKSPYLMVPFLPPTTARDLLGTTVNYSVLSVWPYIRPAWIPWAAYGLDLINTRASFLSANELIDQAFDPYLFVRDAYLQSRQIKIEKVLHPNASNEVDSSTEITDDALGGTATATATATATTDANAKTPAPDNTKTPAASNDNQSKTAS